MKYPISWLKEYVDITIPITELADKLSLAGLEVEAIETVNDGISNVVIGRIEKITPHPNADKLNVTQVFDGTTSHQIVCGAKNIYEGALVPVSLPGAVLPGGFKIKKAKLRDVESNGMICSESELGCCEKSDGIWLLPSDAPLGADFIQWAQLIDVVLEIGILPNRGDCQSIIGLAREISVLLNSPLKALNTEVQSTPLNQPLTIKNDANTLCPLYSARRIVNISQSASPIWLRRRLQLCDIRPISFLVDITNYVLLETGQPLHAFDQEKLAENIIIRLANDKETIKTLDGQRRELSKETLCIATPKGIQAIAGIMGGADTEVDIHTQNIVLESAFFDAQTIRKGCHSVGLRSESAARFEKGVDIENCINAANRACHLIQTIAGGTVDETHYIDKNDTHPLFNKKTIAFDDAIINRLLGSEFTREEMVETLEKIGITITNSTAHIPSWRNADLTEYPCLAEEIARLRGFDQIPSKLPATALPMMKTTDTTRIKTQLMTHFNALGFTECITFPMLGEKDLINAGFEKTENTPEFANPLTQNESLLRPSLLASLLKVAQHNINRQMSSFKLIENGHSYALSSDKKTVKQTEWITLLFTDTTYSNPYKPSYKDIRLDNILQIKGLLIDSIQSISKAEITITPNEKQQLHPVHQGQVSLSDKTVAEFGQLHPSIAKKFNIQTDCGYIAINIDELAKIKEETPQFKEISKLPASRRDIALAIKKSTTYDDISTLIKQNKSKYLTDFYTFDEFESEKLGKDIKSIAIAFIYQSTDTNLTDEDINTAHKKLSETLIEKLDIQIR